MSDVTSRRIENPYNSLNRMLPSKPCSRMSYTCTKGLQNAPGENNCFLNCAVQVLWHLDVFRRSFRILSGHACLGQQSCIFCALKVIFTQFQYSDQSVLPPDALRKALAETFVDKQRFQLGIMDDAAECFENIMYRIHFHIAHEENEDKCQAPHCIPHQKFAMNVVEQTVCKCGGTSKPLPFSQMVLYVSATALASQARKMMEEEGHYFDPSDRFSTLVGRAHTSGDYRDCPANCGSKVLIRKNLMNNPDIVSLGIIWDSDRPSFDQILDVAETIGTTIRLTDLFDIVKDGDCRHTTYHLMGVVCYYGKHYSTFMRHTKSQSWIYFDDATVKEMGRNFQDVIDKCCKGRYQPLLLLYANPDGMPINAATAPKITTLVPNSITPRNHSRSSSRDRSLSPETVMGKEHGYDQGTLTRRAVTPTPNQWENRDHVEAPPRRAVTPGPEWGRYESDGEEEHHKKRPGIEHQRQGSFLIAVSGNLEAKDIELIDAKGAKKQYSGTSGNPIGSNVQGRISTQRNTQQPVEKIYAKTKYGDLVDGKYASLSSQSGRPAVNKQGQIMSVGPGGHNSNYNGQGYGYVDTPHEQKSGKENVRRKTAMLQQKNSSGGSPSRHKRTKSSEMKLAEEDRKANYGYANGQYTGTGAAPDSGLPPGSPQSPTGGWNPNFMNKVNEIQRKESFKKGKGRIGADVIRFHSRCSDDGNSETQEVHPQDTDRPPVKSGSSDNLLSQPRTPKFTRAHSVDDNLSSNASGQNKYSRSKSMEVNSGFVRAKSVEGNLNNYPLNSSSVQQDMSTRLGRTRPYDDSCMIHTGTYVEDGFASLPRPRRKPGGGPHTYVNIDDLSTQREADPKRIPKQIQNNQGNNAGQNEVKDDVLGSYINRKAVESILKLQQQGMKGHFQQQSMNKGLKAKGPMKAQAPFTIMHAGGTKNMLNVPSNVRETLKVDIPDNTSLGSHQDSGYRSNESGTSGDRNSASSASSMSVDSPTVSSSYNQKGIAFHPSQGPIYSMSRQPSRQESKESTKSQSSGQGSNSKPTTPREGSQLDNQQSETLDPNQNNIPNQVLMIPANLTQLTDSNNTLNINDLDPSSYEKQGFRSQFDHLFAMAEDLVEKSNIAESESNFPLALQLSTQAMIAFKQAMDIPYIDYQCFMHAQMKHNACVAKNKGLHQQVMMRQESGQSTQSDVSTGDQQSVSSMSTDTDSRDEPVHAPKGVRRMMKSRSLGQLRERQRANSGNGNARQAAVTNSVSSGTAVSRSTSYSSEMASSQNFGSSNRPPDYEDQSKNNYSQGTLRLKDSRLQQHQQLVDTQRDSDSARDSDTSHTSQGSSQSQKLVESGVYSVNRRNTASHSGPVRPSSSNCQGMAQPPSEGVNSMSSGSGKNIVPSSENAARHMRESIDDSRTYDIYATLPKKGSRRDQEMRQKSKQVYQDYLKQQREKTGGHSGSDTSDGANRSEQGRLDPHKTRSVSSNDTSSEPRKPSKNDIRTMLVKEMQNKQKTPEKKKVPPPPPVRRSSLGPSPDETMQPKETYDQSVNKPQKPPPPEKPSRNSCHKPGQPGSFSGSGNNMNFYDPAALGVQPHQGGHVRNVPNSCVSNRTSSTQNMPPQNVQSGGHFTAQPDNGPSKYQQSHYAPCGPALVSLGRTTHQAQGSYMTNQAPHVQNKQLDTRWNEVDYRALPGNDHCPQCGENSSWIPDTSVCINCDVRGKPPKSAQASMGGIMKKSKSQSHLSFPNENGGTVTVALRCEQDVSTVNTKQLKPSGLNSPSLDTALISSPDLLDLNPAVISPDEGIQMSSDASKQSSTDSDFSGCMRSVKELALRYEPVDLGKSVTERQAVLTQIQAHASRKGHSGKSGKAKSALSKRKDRNMRKSVSFSENLAEDMESKATDESEAVNSNRSEKQSAGYDSDYDEDTSDSFDSEDEQIVRCGLCRKRKVEPPYVYCKDCQNYMSRFVPKSDEEYDGDVKTV